MLRIGFLTARSWPQLSPDDQLPASELRRMGVEVEPVIWDQDGMEWSRYDALVLRSTWDYPEKIQQFRLWLDRMESYRAPLFNPTATVRWNLDKQYLDELMRRGVAVVPTHFAQPGDELAHVLAARGWTDAVVKPRISADGYRTFRTHPHRAFADQPEFERLCNSPNGAMVQPFLSQVRDTGEFSFVFLGGEFSHAVRKRPADGDYRVQPRFGGTVQPHEADSRAVAQVEAVLNAVPVSWIYARVDACPVEDRLVVMEVELIEPSLLFDFAPPAAARRFAELLREIASRRHGLIL